MTQLQKALPCPFCGSSEGLDYQDGSTHRWGVASCVSCGASAGETRREYPDVDEWHYAAMKQWNTRSALAQQRDQQPRAWISSYVDSSNNHGVVLGESREEVIARCEDCMGNQLEYYSEPEPLYTATQAPVEQRCTYCDGTGDIHGIDGEWRGTCPCAAAPVAQRINVTEDMHVAAVKVLQRANGLDGLPQRMLDAMLAAAPSPLAQQPVAWMHEFDDGELIPKLHPSDARLNDQPKSVRPLIYAGAEPEPQKQEPWLNHRGEWTTDSRVRTGHETKEKALASTPQPVQAVDKDQTGEVNE